MKVSHMFGVIFTMLGLGFMVYPIVSLVNILRKQENLINSYGLPSEITNGISIVTGLSFAILAVFCFSGAILEFRKKQ